MSNRSTQRRNNGSAQRGSSVTNGDIPKTRFFDQNTISARLPPVTNVFTVRQTRLPSVLTATSAAQYPAYKFQLNDIDNSADLITIFDEYKLDAIRVTIRSLNGDAGLYTNSTTTLVDLMSVIDYNDVTALSSLAGARQFDNCMILAPGESAVRVFKPKVSSAVFNGLFSGYMSASGWLDVSTVNVEHYGLKLAIPADSVGQTTHQQWELQFDYYISFRNVH